MRNIKLKKEQGALLAVEYALLLCMIVAAYIAFLPDALHVLWRGINALFTDIARILANCVEGGIEGDTPGDVGGGGGGR